ncbi:LPXTG cell wall anchor domain-containing protein [Longimycelium tulufanense]|uniref:LPXTG cell wall anchor domain-containing protein n=1 Tax=Longimycelium tulufanense TaxID=907463 RepID=A0A8J3CD02_9PSEU|nr:hypothetical protein [Longimycelium tulufanense]GGM61137.1 LPXTG cell wall anchor domain-containing protein [Longimycelium tulufanense]
MQHHSVLSALGRALAVAGLVCTGLTPGLALADPIASPKSGDPRAVASPGNATSCSDVNLVGKKIDVTYTVDETNTYLDITEVPDGHTITGVVVKGGNAYNSYLPSALGDLPWKRLHSPMNPSGKPAQISHWFACAQPARPAPTSVPVTPAQRPGSPAEPADTTPAAPAEAVTPNSTPPTASSRPGSTSNPSPTPMAAPAPGDDAPPGGGLASTGADPGWLITLAAVLLTGGVAALAFPRVRAVLRRRN